MPATFSDLSPARAAEPTGDVVCERVDGRSVLTRLRATDPLKLLTPRTTGGAAQVVLSSYGGGLVGGDRVGVRMVVRAGAKLAVTTQSAGKVYRTVGPACEQSLDATVDSGGMLAVLPDASCAFAGSRFQQRQHFDLAADADLVWLDWLSSGRHGRGERWAMNEIVSRTTVTVGGVVRLRETLALDGGAAAIGAAMRAGAFNCYAVLAVFGPRLCELAAAGRGIVRGLDLSSPVTLLAADATAVGGTVFRVLGPDVQTVQFLLVRLLAPLAALLGHDPRARKW